MQFAVIETNEDSDVLVDFVNNHKEFKKLIYSKYPNSKTLDDITFRDLKYNYCFTEGTYLLYNNDKIDYVVKNSNLKKGYVYNSTRISTKLLMSWKIIPSKINKTIKTINNEKEQKLEISMDKFLKFDINKIKSKDKICLIGKKNTGKSLIVSNILDSFSNNLLANCLIISPSHHILFKKLYPFATICTSFNKSTIKEFVATNEDRIIVFDDYLLNENLWENKSVMDLFDNSTFIATIQTPIKFDRIFLNKFDYLFFTQESNVETKKQIFNNYFHFLPGFDTFLNIFNYITEKNTSMVVDINKESKTYNIYYYNYKVKNQ